MRHLLGGSNNHIHWTLMTRFRCAFQSKLTWPFFRNPLEILVIQSFSRSWERLLLFCYYTCSLCCICLQKLFVWMVISKQIHQVCIVNRHLDYFRTIFIPRTSTSIRILSSTCQSLFVPLESYHTLIYRFHPVFGGYIPNIIKIQDRTLGG